MRTKFGEHTNMWKMSSEILIFGFVLALTNAYPFPADDYRYASRDPQLSSPGAHQLASWLASQLRPKELIPLPEIPALPYRLTVQGKRNSEVSNAIIGSEDTQKMYRDGR